MDGTRIHDVSESKRDGFALASCSTSTGDIAVLLRQDSVKPFSPNPSEYTMCIVSPAGQVLSRDVVSPQWLYDAVNGNPAGTVRIATHGADLGIASSWGTRLAVVVLHGSSSTVLLRPGRHAVASRARQGGSRFGAVQRWGCLDRSHRGSQPPRGWMLVGAILRIRADGTREHQLRRERHLGIAAWSRGTATSSAQARSPGAWRGVLGGAGLRLQSIRTGTDLDPSFADSGVAEHDLGGPLAGPVMAFDASGVTIFANVSTQGDPAGDLRTVGCRFQWAPGAPNHGTVDGAFGVAGTVMLHCDEAPITPAGIAVSGSQMFVGGTRQIRGADCDRIPVVVALSLPTGAPNVTYGGGGFALLGSVRNPALVAPDGSAVFAERSTATTVPALRFTTPSGAQGPLRSLAPISAGSWC